MRLLVLGGTKFLGRAVVESALARGHEVTTFTRGQTNPGLFPQVEALHGDRTSDLGALERGRWDVVVDTSGYVPAVVRASAELLSPAAELYVFVSSISVYPEFSQVVHEESPLARLTEGQPDDRLADDFSNYGALKALCEREASDAFGGRSLAVRAGLIVGPHDPTGRFTYWPHRVARGGAVLAPGPPDRPAQFVDVRDLADWIVGAAEERLTGPFNVTARGVQFGELLETARSVTGSDAAPVWVDEWFLLEQEVGQWMELPLWIARDDEGLRFHEVDTTKAHDAGLRERPLGETVRATLEHAALVDGVGLAREREADLLRRWRERA